MDHLDYIEKTSSRIARHARVIYGSKYPSAHTFDVVTTSYIREVPGDSGRNALWETRKENYFTAKLVAFVGENFKDCLLIQRGGSMPSEKTAIDALWQEMQAIMREMRPLKTPDGATWLRPPPKL